MSEALVNAARTSQNRSPAWAETHGRVQSTFTRPIRGGAVWYWEPTLPDGAPDPAGPVLMMTVSPRRVMLELQRAAGVTPDAKYGPETRAALLRLTDRMRPADTNPATVNDANLILQALLAVYHAGRGEVYVPTGTEFPIAAQIREVTGDASYTNAINLSSHAPSAPAPSPGAPAPSAPAPRPAYDPNPAVADPAPRGDVVDLVPRSETAIVPTTPSTPSTPTATMRLTAPGAPVAGALGWVQAHPVATAAIAVGAVALGVAIIHAAQKAR